MRISLDTYYMNIANIAKVRSSCLSRQVGCVITNHRNRVVSIGYNGPPSGIPHCASCLRKSCSTGEALDICPAVHAEMSALIECDPHSIKTVYCTTAPCLSCTKLLLNTSCEEIVYAEDYPYNSADLWKKTGRIWRQI